MAKIGVSVFLLYFSKKKKEREKPDEKMHRRTNTLESPEGWACEAPAAPKPPGLHMTAREPKRAHKNHQNSTMGRERGKKKERNFGRSGGRRSGRGRSGGEAPNTHNTQHTHTTHFGPKRTGQKWTKHYKTLKH